MSVKMSNLSAFDWRGAIGRSSKQLCTGVWIGDQHTSVEVSFEQGRKWNVGLLDLTWLIVQCLQDVHGEEALQASEPSGPRWGFPSVVLLYVPNAPGNSVSGSELIPEHAMLYSFGRFGGQKVEFWPFKVTLS